MLPAHKLRVVPADPAAAGRGRHPLRWIAGIILVALAVGAAVRWTHAPAPPPKTAAAPAPVLTVTTVAAAERTQPRTLPVTGSVSAWDPLSVGAEVSGLRIESVPVEENDEVRRGQVLATLDASILRAQLDQARARLLESRNNYAKALQPNRPQDIEGMRAALQQAEANLEQERANLIQQEATGRNAADTARRYATLLAQGYASRQEAENNQAAAESAGAVVAAARDRVTAARYAVEQARQRLSLAQAGGRREDVAMARAGAAEMLANIQQLEAQIAQTVIRAPDDGLILQRNAHVGDITASGKPLFVMARKSRFELRAQVAQSEIRGIQVGDPAVVSSGGRRVMGRVWLVAPQVDAATRLGTARILLPAHSGLRPGDFVQAAIQLGQQRTLVVPAESVLGPPDGHYLFVLQDSRARRRSVTVRGRSGGEAEIASGLRPGEPVIVAGAAFLNDGDVVAVAAQKAEPVEDRRSGAGMSREAGGQVQLRSARPPHSSP